ncbi:imm11 family protein [Loktanella sp. S4079]|uniref:imm11 family protein n=1 Tax=Loktanella sp. S4079 TaxID=579483 RepID=UPI0005FA5A4F|nr:DUF1629 domain-containing protein [Loktanella sp. S4079]KJZ20683.1 hypothetical protein TW80_07910 [Loktanella sp. S4079]
MVWAVHEASGFGKFFLNGDFVGWKEGLQKHWDEIGADDDARNTFSVARKFTEDFGPLEDVEMVKQFETKKNVKEIAALAEITNKLLIAHQSLKEIIEEAEPGIHQFWPMEIVMPREKIYPESYFGMRIGQFLDSFQPDESDEASFHDSPLYFGSDTKKATAGLAMSPSIIGDAQIWREKRIRRPNIFISDALQQRILDAGLQLPKHYQTMVV